jgi:hypothetical protein
MLPSWYSTAEQYCDQIDTSVTARVRGRDRLRRRRGKAELDETKE